jgi:large subunit ribosomal protein L21
MYAVVETGGKQYRVKSGDVIKVEKLAGVAGETIALSKVLAASDGTVIKIGAPVVEKASVEAEILEQGRGDKVIVFKKKRRQNYRRKNGHRQDLTVLRIASITVDGKKTVAEKKVKAAPAAATTEAAAEKPAKAAKPAAKAADAEKKPAAKKTAAKKAE